MRQYEIVDVAKACRTHRIRQMLISTEHKDNALEAIDAMGDIVALLHALD